MPNDQPFQLKMDHWTKEEGYEATALALFDKALPLIDTVRMLRNPYYYQILIRNRTIVDTRTSIGLDVIVPMLNQIRNEYINEAVRMWIMAHPEVDYGPSGSNGLANIEKGASKDQAPQHGEIQEGR